METNIQPIKKSNKAAYIILALVLIAAAVLLWQSHIGQVAKEKQQQSQQTQKLQVPQELILGRQIETEMNFHSAPKGKDFVVFNSIKTREELIDFYIDKFSKEGWTIVMNQVLKNGNYHISVRKDNEQVDVTILAKPPMADTKQKGSEVSVVLVYKDLLSKVNKYDSR